MMAWFLIATVAYAIMAFSQVMDKVFLDKFFKESSAYASFVGLAGLVVIFTLPWTVALPSVGLFMLALVAGALFVCALLPFLSALQSDEATRVIPVTGATVPLAAMLFERVFLGVQLSATSYGGAIFLILGGVLLTASRKHGQRRSWLAGGQAFFSGLLFATSFVLSKYIFGVADFWTSFVCMRVGGGAAGLTILCFSEPALREAKRLLAKAEWRVLGLYAGNQGLAAIGFGLQSYAIALATAGLVTALQGVQYVFILAFVVIFARFKPSLLSERVTKQVLLEKLTATACLITGLALLAL